MKFRIVADKTIRHVAIVESEDALTAAEDYAKGSHNWEEDETQETDNFYIVSVEKVSE